MITLSRVGSLSWGDIAELAYDMAYDDAEAEADLREKRWKRWPVPYPLWVLDRRVPRADRPERELPLMRLLHLRGFVSDTTGTNRGVWFDATHYFSVNDRWECSHKAIITAADRFGAVWVNMPSVPRWREMAQRVKLAAQLGNYITAPLPEDYR